MRSDGPLLEIVGTPTLGTADELPLLLTPILRTVGEEREYYLADDVGDCAALAPADAEWIEAEFADRTMRRFEAPIRVKSDHVLLQLRPSAPPEYLPSGEVDRVLKESAEKALRRAADCASVGDRLGAACEAGYATRARPDDPLPLLVTWALGLRVFSPAAMRVLARDLRGFPQRTLENAVLQTKDDLAPLRAFIVREWEHLGVGPLPGDREDQEQLSAGRRTFRAGGQRSTPGRRPQAWPRSISRSGNASLGGDASPPRSPGVSRWRRLGHGAAAG